MSETNGNGHKKSTRISMSRNGNGTAHKPKGGAREGAGRPRRLSPEQLTGIEKARRFGASRMEAYFKIMDEIATNPDAPQAARVRAAEFVANRSGMPAEQKVTTESEGKAMLALVATLGEIESIVVDETPEP